MKEKIASLMLIWILILSFSYTAFAENAGCPSPAKTEEKSSTIPAELPLEDSAIDVNSPDVPKDSIPEPSSEPNSTPFPTETPKHTASLAIDTAHTYHDMDKPFQDGYIPKVENGYASFVLPLTHTGDIKDDSIQVSLDLGANANEAFVAASYEKTFSLTTEQATNAESENDLFLVEFSVQLASERINGIYPITAHVSGYDITGNPLTFSYTVFVTISDGKSNEVQPSPEPTPEVPTADPVVYISNCVTEPATIMAGEPFTVTLTLKNSLKSKNVKNLLITVDTGDLAIDLQEKSNVFSIEHIKAGGESKLILHFLAEPTLPEGKHKINVSFQYNSNSTFGITSNGVCALNVRQPAELSFDGAKLPKKVFQDDTVTVTMNLMNTGKSQLYNCKIDYAIDGLASGGSTFLGELAPGESKPGKGNLRVSNETLGEINGTIAIQYEDAYGEQYTKNVDVSTFIEEKPEPVEQEAEKDEKSNPYTWLTILISIVLGIGGGFGFSWYLQERKQRKEDDLKL